MLLMLLHTQVKLSKRTTTNFPPKLEFSTNNMIHDDKPNLLTLAKLQNPSIKKEKKNLFMLIQSVSSTIHTSLQSNLRSNKI